MNGALEGSAPGAEAAGSPANALALRAAMLVCAVALGLRLLHVLASTDSPYFSYPIIDAETYDRAAMAIATGHGHPDTVFWQPPGYAYFLGALYALFGRGGVLVPRLVQALLGALASVLVAWVGARLFGPKVGFGAGLGTAAYGTLIYFDGELLAPSPTITLQLTALALALKAGSTRRADAWWFLAGFAEGLAAVFTATSLVLLPVLAGFARRRALVVLAGAALAILPVTVRNVVHGGEFVLISSNGGINLYIGNNPRYDETVGIRPGRDWQALVSEPAQHGVHGASASSRYFTRRVGDFLATDPGGVAALQLRKLYLTVGGDEIYRNQAIYPARTWSPVLRVLLWKVPGLAFPFGVLLPLAVVGVVASGRRAPLLVLMVVAYTAAVVAFFVAARYRVPLVPLLLIFAAEGVRWLVQGASRRQRVTALAGAAVVFAVVNLDQGEMSPRMNADAEFGLAFRLSADKRDADAVPHYEAALREKPDYTTAWVNLGVSRARLGRPVEAEAAFRRALEINPKDASAITSLGTLRWRAGRLEEARELYEAALAIDPTHRAARLSLAKLLQQSGLSPGAPPRSP